MGIAASWGGQVSVTRKRDIVGPFRVALGGLVYTFKTQRHMRFHLYVVLIVVMLGILVNLQLREMLVLLFTISGIVGVESVRRVEARYQKWRPATSLDRR